MLSFWNLLQYALLPTLLEQQIPGSLDLLGLACTTACNEEAIVEIASFGSFLSGVVVFKYMLYLFIYLKLGG